MHHSRTEAYDSRVGPVHFLGNDVSSMATTGTVANTSDDSIAHGPQDPVQVHPHLLPGSVTNADRNDPSETFIEYVSRTFPSEREVDIMLTRKMRRRRGPVYAGASLRAMTGHVAALLRGHGIEKFEISDARWFSGGASKIQMGFTLHWDEPGVGRAATRLVARMEPAESLNSTSRRREYELLQAFAGVIPVPRVYWVDPDGTWFPEPALIYAYAEGSSKPNKAMGKVAGIGTNYGPELRQRLAPQFIEYLARIHTFEHEQVAFDAFDRPEVGTTQSALWQLNRARRIWEEDRGEDLPLMEVASNWLERNLPVLDCISVVHGDYRSGNFLFDESTARITAILDWERGYLGDRHRDLAWTTAEQYGHWSEDGKTFLASGIASTQELLDRYEAISGLRVDPIRMRYYRVFNCYQIVVTALASSYRVVSLGKTHQDVLVAWIEAAAYGAMEELRREMERSL